MDLAKQYVILWLSAEAARLLLPQADDEHVWGVVGQVHGETPGVGLWLRVESIASIPGEISPPSGTPETFLIPWHAVRIAQLLGAKPIDLRRTPGFLP
jgi:hypothetical protein